MSYEAKAMLEIDLLPDAKRSSDGRTHVTLGGNTFDVGEALDHIKRVPCVRCGYDVPIRPLLGLCETCTRLDLSFRVSTSRRHVRGQGN